MTFRAFGMAVAMGAVLWAMSGTQRERPLLAGSAAERVRWCEARVASHPADGAAARALAQAYLDAQQPGLAVAWLERAHVGLEGARADASTQHLYARALLEEGRNGDALAVETSVVAACMPLREGESPARDCDAALLGSAIRRVGILKEMVVLGVEDTRAQPEASFVAYQIATHEARVASE